MSPVIPKTLEGFTIITAWNWKLNSKGHNLQNERHLQKGRKSLSLSQGLGLINKIWKEFKELKTPNQIIWKHGSQKKKYKSWIKHEECSSAAIREMQINLSHHSQNSHHQENQAQQNLAESWERGVLMYCHREWNFVRFYGNH